MGKEQSKLQSATSSSSQEVRAGQVRGEGEEGERVCMFDGFFWRIYTLLILILIWRSLFVNCFSAKAKFFDLDSIRWKKPWRDPGGCEENHLQQPQHPHNSLALPQQPRRHRYERLRKRKANWKFSFVFEDCLEGLCVLTSLDVNHNRITILPARCVEDWVLIE